MAESQSASAGSAREEGTPARLPSYEEQHQSSDVLLTEEARRIRWRLNGPLTTAISIMEAPDIDPDTAVFEPYYNGPDENATGETWHPFSQLPYTTPPVSSISVSVEPLDEWLSHWLEQHEFHVSEGDYDPARTRFGPLPLPGSEDDDVTPYEEETGRRLESCCGSERPVNKGTNLVVRATDKDFVTIHDFLSAAHPYLMDRRAEIVAAMHAEQYGVPVPAEEDLFVGPMYGSPELLCPSDEGEWLKRRRPVGWRPLLDEATRARLDSYGFNSPARLEQVRALLAGRRLAEPQGAGAAGD